MCRIEDHRGSCDRVGQEPAGRHHPDAVLALRLRPARSADLHGRPHAEMHPILPPRRLIWQSHRRLLRGLCFQFL